jgi:DNA-binding GntR family transcriptional regulator
MPTPAKRSTRATQRKPGANAAEAFPAVAPAPCLPDDQIYARLHTAIARQQLPPGTRLREDEIRQIFNVSRTRIRTVFSRLAHAGIVTLEPNRGASVTTPTVQEAREIFAARRTIEGTIVAQAVRHAKPQDMARLREHLTREQVADTRRDRTGMIQLSGEFHLLIAEIGGNEVLRRFLADLITRESLVLLAYERPGRSSCSNHEHHDILEAFEKHDPDLAARLMIEHLHAIEERLDFGERERPPIDLSRILAGSADR